LIAKINDVIESLYWLFWLELQRMDWNILSFISKKNWLSYYSKYFKFV